MYPVPRGSIMSDDHKVNKIDRWEVLPSEVKDFLMVWLFRFGRDAIPNGKAWDYLDNANINYDIDATMQYCHDRGFIDNLQDPFTRIYNKRLTDEGLEYVNEQ